VYFLIIPVQIVDKAGTPIGQLRLQAIGGTASEVFHAFCRNGKPALT
jgi:hypothetical protein